MRAAAAFHCPPFFGYPFPPKLFWAVLANTTPEIYVFLTSASACHPPLLVRPCCCVLGPASSSLRVSFVIPVCSKRASYISSVGGQAFYSDFPTAHRFWLKSLMKDRESDSRAIREQHKILDFRESPRGRCQVMSKKVRAKQVRYAALPC